MPSLIVALLLRILPAGPAVVVGGLLWALLVVGVLVGPVMMARAAPSDHEQIARLLHRNFTYVEQMNDRARVVSGERPFRGDCDDFALAAAYQLYVRGYEPEVVFLGQRRGNHIIACADGWCLDNEREQPYRRHRAKGRVIAERKITSDPVLMRQYEAIRIR